MRKRRKHHDSTIFADADAIRDGGCAYSGCSAPQEALLVYSGPRMMRGEEGPPSAGFFWFILKIV